MIFVTGHTGCIGSAIVKKLKLAGYKNILTKKRNELDLTNQNKVYSFLKKNKPKFIIIAAAKVGGIMANIKYPAEFIYQNISIQSNLIHSAYLNNIKNIIFLASSCVYPKNSKQPLKESYLLNGKPEETNCPYAIAKIAGIKMCESYNKQYNMNYISLIPCNAYGPNNNYDLNNSHFFSAIMKKIYDAKSKHINKINLLGNANTRRELIFSEDLADACIFFMKKKTKHKVINIGTGVDMSIKDYTKFILNQLNVKYSIEFNGKFMGIKKKLLDVSLMKKLGFFPKVSLKEGFKITYKDFIKKYDKI